MISDFHPPPFEPLFGNPHFLTVAGNFWPREIDEIRFPGKRVPYEINPGTTVVAFEHQPLVPSRAQLVLIHGLEGSADAGYIRSFAQDALLRGFGVHRANLRSCGGTEDICETMYHSGLTSDTLQILKAIRSRNTGPVFLVGFSLGGNVALKLTSELGDTSLLAGTCAVSTPIDLAVCVRAIDRPSNVVYASRFLNRLKGRIRRKNISAPHLYRVDELDRVKTIWEFDDRFTAPLFGFGTAANYYKTQSAIRYLDEIRVPTLLIAAQDDPLVPFQIYEDARLEQNPAVTLLAPRRGGHLGFLSKRKPRFWLDKVALDWFEMLLGERACSPLASRGTNERRSTSE